MGDWPKLTDEDIMKDLGAHLTTQLLDGNAEEEALKCDLTVANTRSSSEHELNIDDLREKVQKSRVVQDSFIQLKTRLLSRKIALAFELEALKSKDSSVPDEFVNQKTIAEEIKSASTLPSDFFFCCERMTVGDHNRKTNELDQLHQITDSEEYFSLLKKSLPIQIEAAELLPKTLSAQSSHDTSEHQSVRDIERDTLIINGQIISGSDGFDQVLNKMRDHAVGLDPFYGRLMSGQEWEPLIESFCKLALRAVNRTESGSLSYEALQLITREASIPPFLIVPDSKAAEPLQLQMRLSPCKNELLPVPLQYFHGVAVHLKATTVYNFYSDDMETKYLKVRVTYTNSMAFPVSPPFPTVAHSFEDLGYCSSDGQITIEASV